MPAGKPVTLVFKRVTDKTCAKACVLTMDDGKTIVRELPLDTPVELTATFPKAGKLACACSMNMIKGTVVACSDRPVTHLTTPTAQTRPRARHIRARCRPACPPRASIVGAGKAAWNNRSVRRR